MKRWASCALGLSLMSIPSASGALQLHWSSGATDLTCQSATRCTLVVEAAPAASLPQEWRLVWCADGAVLEPVVSDPVSGCERDTAQVASFDRYSAAEDGAAGLATAQFCSGSGGSDRALYVLDRPAGSHGNLRAVALDPSDPDSERVVQSNDATFNGGVDQAYPAIILRSASDHASVPFSVTAIGTGLAAATVATVAARGAALKVPLSIVERSDTRLTAVADIPEALPPAAVRISAGAAGSASIVIPADPVSGPDLNYLPYIPVYSDPNPTVSARDFAFIYNVVPHPVYGWHGVFHLFYIRHFTGNVAPADNETTFVHAWYRPWASGDLWWEVDSTAFSRSRVGWDSKHVWAPSIITSHDGRSYMFYTGVDDLENQRIGFASTSLIDTSDTQWTRESGPAFTADQAEWVDKHPPQQFRDPFVIEDPNHFGRYLMLYAGLNKNDAHTAVGIAQSDSGSLTHWTDLGYYRGTDYAHSGGAVRIESPHFMPDSTSAHLGQLASATWRLFYTDGAAGPYSAVQFEPKLSTATPLTDTTAASWGYPATSLYSYLDDVGVNGWYASEWLKAGSVMYLAAVHVGRIEIRRLFWTGTDFSEGPAYTAAVNDAARMSDEVRFRLAELAPGQGRARFRIELPAPMATKVVVYDVMGRRIRTAHEGPMPAGRNYVSWDGHDGAGARVSSGMYFVRLSTTAGSRVVRVPMLR